MTRVFASWSGGKDGCLALYRAIHAGMEVRYLANMVSADGLRSRSHGMAAAVIQQQAKALGIPLKQQTTEDDTYRERFIEMVEEMKKEGVEGGVFGDIDFNAHREWLESVCSETGISLNLPLWLEDQQTLVEEFIDAGFKSVIIAVRKDTLGTEFLGRIIDRSFMNEIKATNKDITPCGEAGEFHSLVIDGPIFKKRLKITKSQIETRGDHHFMEILSTELQERS